MTEAQTKINLISVPAPSADELGNENHTGPTHQTQPAGKTRTPRQLAYYKKMAERNRSKPTREAFRCCPGCHLNVDGGRAHVVEVVRYGDSLLRLAHNQACIELAKTRVAVKRDFGRQDVSGMTQERMEQIASNSTELGGGAAGRERPACA